MNFYRTFIVVGQPTFSSYLDKHPIGIIDPLGADCGKDDWIAFEDPREGWERDPRYKRIL